MIFRNFLCIFLFFFFNDTATTEIYTLSLHGRSSDLAHDLLDRLVRENAAIHRGARSLRQCVRSEEHTSELQSHLNLVCRLLLEKKKKIEKQSPPRKKKEKRIDIK